MNITELREVARLLVASYNEALPFQSDDQHKLMGMLDTALSAAPTPPIAGKISINDALPACTFECAESGADISETVVVYGEAVNDFDGCGLGHLQDDGKWVCYEGEHDFMNVKEVTHWARLPHAVAHTPPEVGPVGYVCQYFDDGAWYDCSGSDQCHYADDGYETRTLFTSPPSPKAEWSETGEPLNLEAAARDVVAVINKIQAGQYTKIDQCAANLRKFLGDGKS